MTAIERTAYPRFKSSFTPEELEHFYQPTEAETSFVFQRVKSEKQQLTLMVLLKGFQKLGRLPQTKDIPKIVKRYIAEQMGLTWDETIEIPRMTRSRYRKIIYQHLGIKAYQNGGEEVVEKITETATRTMSDPADLINVAIEQLILQRFELPAFSRLNRVVNHIRHLSHQKLYKSIASRLSDDQKTTLDNLLIVEANHTRNQFNQMKALPASYSLLWVRHWEEHMDRLDNILDPNPILADLPSTKIEQFASQAYQMEISDIKGVLTAEKRYTLLLCLLYQMQVRTRDQLTLMFIKRMRLLHNSAKKRLQKFRDEHLSVNEMMIDAFADVVQSADETDQLSQGEKDTALGKKVREIIDSNGGAKELQLQCDLLQAFHDNNYFPLLPHVFKSSRSTPFRLTKQLIIKSASRSHILLQALDYIQEHHTKRKKHLPEDVSIAFASPRWQAFIREKVDGVWMLKKQPLEICVFSHIADGLSNGDLFVEGTESYADYHSQLTPWAECEAILDQYCSIVNLPTNSNEFVQGLRSQFVELANRVDNMQTSESDLYFDSNGKPHLRQLSKSITPENAEELKAIMMSRLPERHLLDVLHNVHHWIDYTRHFGPPSGADSKIHDPLSRYLLTIFGYGCNLGPAQTARHARGLISERVIGRLNAQHITTEKLDTAIRDIINEYSRFSLPFIWGSGKAAVADGTHYELYENNLMGERHIRYGGYGGIAYHHISDTYVALFSQFIACGVWEAVYILDGLLENKSVLQPDTVIGDTHGQSEAVFGLAHLLGIKLMPRMKNWNKVSMYWPERGMNLKNIGSWFTRYINWDLIEEHWQDMMQVILSIHNGNLLPSWLLQKLNSHSPKNKLYLAFRELGRVIRTMFLLEYVSNTQLRREVRAATTKIEAYNYFSQWITFGGEGILRFRDPVENEKIIKYKDLIANAIMLQNVVDMSNILHEMAGEGLNVTADAVATFSPYLREHIKRFGEYFIDLETVPPPLQPDIEFLAV